MFTRGDGSGVVWATAAGTSVAGPLAQETAATADASVAGTLTQAAVATAGAATAALASHPPSHDAAITGVAGSSAAQPVPVGLAHTAVPQNSGAATAAPCVAAALCAVQAGPV